MSNMRIIILGYRKCPHCRALVRLLKECKDITTFGYIEIDEFSKNYLSSADRDLYIKKLQTEVIGLPYALYKTENESWKRLNIEAFTNRALTNYAKRFVSKKNQ